MQNFPRINKSSVHSNYSVTIKLNLSKVYKDELVLENL